MHQSHLTSAFFAIILTTRVAAQIPHLKARTVPGYHFPVPTGLVERQIIDPDTCSNQWTRFCTLCDVLEDCNYSVITLTCNCAWDKPPSIPDPDPDPDPTPITTTKTPPKPSPDPTPTTTNINGFPPLPFPDHPDGGGDPFPVITVVGGKTFTGTFSVTTIEKYKSLRSKTTIATKTANNGKETDISVTIYPGGISWWPSKQSGPNGDPIPPISEPKEKPTSGTPDDDKSCDPQPKCKDCGSSDSLCKSGDKSGCPCEQGEDEDGKECPSEPPMCKDCGSGDKDSDLTICPSGDNKDCPCKKEEKQCPLEPPTCKANDCGGDENILKCSKEEVKDCRCCPEKIDCPADDCAGDKDRKCTTDKLKSCKCEGSHGDAVPVHVEPSRPLPNQADIDALAWDIFQDLFQGDEKLLNPDEEVPQEPQNPPSSTPTKIFLSVSIHSPQITTTNLYCFIVYICTTYGVHCQKTRIGW